MSDVIADTIGAVGGLIAVRLDQRTTVPREREQLGRIAAWLGDHLLPGLSILLLGGALLAVAWLSNLLPPAASAESTGVRRPVLGTTAWYVRRPTRWWRRGAGCWRRIG